MTAKTPTADQTSDAADDLVRPRLLLTLEGAAVLGLSLLAYQQHGGSWLLFFLLILAADLSMLGFLAGPRIGALTYNLAHTYVAPALLAAVGLLADQSLAISIAIIWFAHIGADRMLGYGLKYATGFRDTHLGRV